jgi:hypothetical protein
MASLQLWDALRRWEDTTADWEYQVNYFLVDVSEMQMLVTALNVARLILVIHCTLVTSLVWIILLP